ncbi:MAG TPA: BrnT family toxin [Bryobacteraceae bacterium]|nr:BrnT family toxin [Bryobacteraceae bacterium]
MIRYEWDDAKEEINRAKHGIAFTVAQLVFDDPSHISFVSNVVKGEDRWTSIGSVEGVIVLVVVHDYREEPPHEMAVSRILCKRILHG